MHQNTWRVLAGAAVIAAVVVVDVAATDRGVFAEGAPLVSSAWLVRSAVLALAAFLVVSGAGGATAPPRRPTPRPEHIGVAAGTAFVVLAGTAVLMIADPELLNRLVTEDGWVEWISAMVWFMAAAVLGWAALWSWGACGWWPVRLGMLALGGAYALIGLEEVSWFQRVLDIESQGRFLENGQKEINLHNFATTFSGQSFFIGVFLFGAFAAFVADSGSLPPAAEPFRPLVPRRATIVLVGAASALTYETWNIAFFQLAFFASLGILAIIALRSRNLALAAVCLLMIPVQLVSLTYGDEMIRAWDESEVRESLIPFGLLLHALALRAPPIGRSLEGETPKTQTAAPAP